ncbi:MAG: hypothetical protein ACE5Q6_26465 [Dehalococcoidia bacterium]
MAQDNRSEDRSNRSGTVDLQDLPEGAKVRLQNGAIAEVTANPRDGGWIFIRIVEHPEDPSKIGEEDMVFCTDVLAVV